jgi:hypothetical protein
MLLVITGPPAVGKMTVGRALADVTDFRLFHNHATIEPLLEVFGSWDHPAFSLLKDEFRVRVLEEAARHGTDLILTFVWPVDDPADADVVRSYIRPFVAAGQEVAFVELDADLGVRLERNRGQSRLAEKPSKRDLTWSEAHVREVAADRMVTDPDRPSPADAVLFGHRHLRLDTSSLSADQAADRIKAWLEDGPRTH